jgi:Trk K+ transport system NAD-binding subunit
VIDRRPAPRLAELDTATLQSLGADLLEVHPDDLGIAPGSRLAELELPAAAVVVAIERADELLLPRGSTAIEAPDVLYLLVESDRLREVRAALQRVADAKP